MGPPSVALSRPLHQHLEQQLAARREVFGFRVLGLVVADAACGGHEDHGRGHHVGQVAGVVAGGNSSFSEFLHYMSELREWIFDRNKFGEHRVR